MIRNQESLATLNEFLLHIEESLYSYLSVFPMENRQLHILKRQINAREEIRSRKNFTGHLTASAVVFDHDFKRLLLVHNKSLSIWVQPGGHYNGNETMEGCAYREACEELGSTQITLHPWHSESGIPIDINSHFIPENKAKDEPNHYHHDFRYIFFVEDGFKVSFDKIEINGVKWQSIDEISPKFSIHKVLDKMFQMFLLRLARKAP